MALGTGVALYGLVITTTFVQGGGPGRMLALQLVPGMLLVLAGLVWRSGPIHLRAYFMLGGFWTGVVAAGLARGISIPNPWVAALFVCVLAALTLEKRKAWVATVITVLLWVGVSARWVSGGSLPNDVFADPSDPTNWARVIVIFALFAGASVGGVLYNVTRLEHALHRAESLYDALESESALRLETQRKSHALEVRLQHAQKLEALGTLAGAMAHDVNNLLQVITTNTELAFTETEPTARQAGMTDLNAASEQASRLTRQLLTFSRHSGGHKTHLNVADEVRESVGRIAPLLSGVTVSFEQEGEPPAVWGPASVVHQIVMNLALNARDALGDSGTVWVRTSRVSRLCEGVMADYALLSVRDEGIGMDADTQLKVFDPFFTTKGAGAGLGLHLVRSLAEACGGFVEITSAPEQGTEVKVFLAQGTACVEPRATTPNCQPRKVRLRILAVDDDDAVRRTLRRSLQYDGHDVVEASSGAEALAIYRTNPTSFDVVISDAMMPEMGGRELYEELSAITPDVRFLVCSGYTADVFEEGFFDKPHCRFLGKPFRSQELIDLLASLVE